MPRIVAKLDKQGKQIVGDDGKLVMTKLYDPKEKFDYHVKVATNGSGFTDPKTGEFKAYSKAKRARSRGWLSHANMESKIYKKRGY